MREWKGELYLYSTWLPSQQKRNGLMMPTEIQEVQILEILSYFLKLGSQEADTEMCIYVQMFY